MSQKRNDDAVSVEEPGNQAFDLLFGVRRSVRYHHRRQRFFDGLNTVVNTLTAVAGSGTIITAVSDLGDVWVKALAATTALSAALELAFGTARKARLHNDFARDWISLEREILLAQDDLSISQLRTFQARRMEIEADEPPPLKVLDAICHNEMLRSMGYKKSAEVEIGWWKRAFANFFDFREHTLGQP